MMNLIFEDMAFNEQFKTFFKNENFTPEDGKVYQSLGIIGCQSSGKSTLLNHVFNTNFEIMSEEKGRAQTTKGIWIGINKEYKVIIFDVEGTDSKERGDDRFKFEQCSSLFTLAMSDVLLINMWTNDIGRYTASNYGILKVVFEQNLKLSQQESEKKIIIVLRDFDPNVDDLNKLKESIINDMRKIWEEIPKPEKFKDKSCTEYFRFDFLTLAHKFYQEDKFMEGIEAIKQKLKREKDDNKTGNNPYSIFSLVNYEKNIPIDGFYDYALDMWTKILDNKDLNIPGQKEMLARFKCDEIKLMALNAVEQKINDLEMSSSIEVLPDFNKRANAILKEVLENYDPLAKNYLNPIYLNVRKILQSELANKMYSSFSNQLKKLIPKYQKEFKNTFINELKTNNKFFEVSNKLKKIFSEKLAEELEKLRVFKDWDTGKESEVIFEEIIENQRNICLEEEKEKLIEHYTSLIDDTIVNRLELVQSSFWVEIQQEMFTNFSQNLLLQKIKLVELYQITDEEFKTFTQNCENDIYRKIKLIFLREMHNFPDIQVDNFKKDFWYKDSIPKVWNQINLTDITYSYEENSNKYKNLFLIFKKLKIIEHPLKLCDYENKPVEEMEKIEKETIPEIINSPKEEGFEPLIDDKTLHYYLNKYEDKIKEIYDEAVRRHNNIASSRIPLWAWALLIFISYKDIWKMITGYWLILFIFLSGLYALLRMIGLGNTPIMIFNMIKSQINQLYLKSKMD